MARTEQRLGSAVKLHRTHDAMLLLIILGKHAMDAVACLLQRLGLGR